MSVLRLRDLHVKLDLVKTDSDVRKLSDLNAKRVSAIRGSAPELFALQTLTNADVVALDGGLTARLALRQNKMQGEAMPLWGAIGFRSRSKGATKFLDEVLHWEPDCIGVKHGGTTLLATVNIPRDNLGSSAHQPPRWGFASAPTSACCV